jgi:hypothetical protein
MGRPLLPVSISGEDQAQLQGWTKRPKTAQALAMRSRVILLAADGLSNTKIAQQLSVSLQTVGKWRQRYLDQGVDGLLDEPRPGTSCKLADKDVERVLALTLESTPTDATHWSSAHWRRDRGTTCTSHPLRPVGSTWSSDGSPCSLKSNCGAECIARPKN